MRWVLRDRQLLARHSLFRSSDVETTTAASGQDQAFVGNPRRVAPRRVLVVPDLCRGRAVSVRPRGSRLQKVEKQRVRHDLSEPGRLAGAARHEQKEALAWWLEESSLKFHNESQNGIGDSIMILRPGRARRGPADGYVLSRPDHAVTAARPKKAALALTALISAFVVREEADETQMISRVALPVASISCRIRTLREHRV
jgi:hypothetical protein